MRQNNPPLSLRRAQRALDGVRLRRAPTQRGSASTRFAARTFPTKGTQNESSDVSRKVAGVDRHTLMGCWRRLGGVGNRAPAIVGCGRGGPSAAAVHRWVPSRREACHRQPRRRAAGQVWRAPAAQPTAHAPRNSAATRKNNGAAREPLVAAARACDQGALRLAHPRARKARESSGIVRTCRAQDFGGEMGARLPCARTPCRARRPPRRARPPLSRRLRRALEQP